MSRIRERLQYLRDEIPNALLLAVLTAATTIILALIMSMILGADQRAVQKQAVRNAQEVLDHAVIARCEMAHVVDMLRTIGEQAEMLDLSEYAPINTEGLDCEFILSEPFEPGLNYIDTDPAFTEPD